MGERREVDKRVLFLFMLLVASAVVLLYAKTTFTGFSVLEGYENQTACEAANYTWEDLTGESCTNLTGCITCEEGCVQNHTQILCTAGCSPVACTEGNTSCVACAAGCVEQYTEILCAGGCKETCENCTQVITGGQCTGEICDLDNLNLCLNEAACTEAEGHWYDNACNAEEECIPETCESLSYNCGSIDDGCETTLECGDCDSGYTCNSGTCEVEETDENEDGIISSEDEVNEEIPTTTLITQNTQPECVPNMECGEWQECIDGTQIRLCTDSNQCNPNEAASTESQPCVVEIPETCEDGIKNQDETEIDCGGVCEKCGFLTIVGSAVSGTVDAGRKFVFENMFKNLTRTLISVGGFVLVIGGFIASRFLFKKKKDIKKLDKAIDSLPDEQEEE